MKIGFLGGGSWGTALGIMLYEKNNDVYIWEIDKERVERVNKIREIEEFLPGVKIPEGIVYSNDMEKVIEEADIIVLAVPSHALRSVISNLPSSYKPKRLCVSVIKGIEVETKKRMSEIWKEFFDVPIAVISGPSIAREVVRKMPTSVVCASEIKEIAVEVQHIFSAPYFRIYTSDDVIGVELGGALKNIIAIAAGISDGLGFLTNTKGAILTRGMVEITRLGVAMGAKKETFAGLSGMGDMITTSFSENSRNRYVGYWLGKGKKIDEILKGMRMIAEGVRTSKAAVELAKNNGVEIPITESVYRIIYEGSHPKDEMKRLLSRPLKDEIW